MAYNSRFTKTVARSTAAMFADQISALTLGLVGDGITDDGPALNAAIADAGNVGGAAIYFPGGYTYLLKTPVTLVSNVQLIGQGAKSLFKRNSGSNMPGGSGMINITGSNCGIRDIAFDGSVTVAAGVNYSAITDPMQSNLTLNSSIWIKPGASGVTLDNIIVQHTGGYAVLIDARNGDVIDVRILNSNFLNNRPHLFGFDPADLNYGSWTGGIHYQGDCETGAHYNARTGQPAADHLWSVKNLLVDGCTFRRGTGNQVWGHAYAFDTMHSNVRVTNCYFEDIGRDAIQLAVTSGGSASDNKGRRIGYICTDDVSPSVPKYLGGQYAVFIDTSGTKGVDYTGNSAVSVHGAFFDLDGFSYGTVEGNICRVPSPTDFEYAEDSVATWAVTSWNGSSSSTSAPGNFTYGAQTGNNYFTPGGTNVAIVNNTFVNCGYGAIRLFAARGCHVAGNTINHPAAATYAPVILGNFNPASGAGQTNTFNNDCTQNNIQWSPAAPAAAVQELENWSGSAILWSGGQKNWIADNRIFGSNAFEFSKAPSSSSVTGTVISTQMSSPSSDGHAQIARENVSSVAFTSLYGPTGDLHWRYLDSIGQLNVAKNGVKGSVTTGVRIGVLAVDDTVATSHLYADGFLAIMGKDYAPYTTYADTDANALDGHYGLIRFNNTSGAFEQSVSVSGGARVWTPLGTSVAGADKQLQYNKTGAQFADANLIWDYASQKLAVTGTGVGSLALAVLTGYVDSAGGFATSSSSSAAVNVPNGTVQANNLTTKNALYFVGIPTASAPSLVSAAGYGILYYDTTAGKLMLSLNAGAFTPIAGATVAGSNTQVQYNSSGALGASPNFTFAGNILTVGSGPGTGVIAPLFNANAGSTNLEFQGSNFSVTGDGHIATNGWLDFGERSSAPATASAHGLLYVSNSHALRWSANNGAFTDIINSAGTYVGPGVQTQSAINGGAFGLWTGSGYGTFVSNSGGNILGNFNILEINGAAVATQSWVTLQNYATQSFVTSQGYIVGVKTSGGAAYSNSGGYAVLSFIDNSGFITCGALSTSGSVNAANYQISGTNGATFTFQDLAGVTHSVQHGLVVS